MTVDLKNFVDINIQRHVQSDVESTRNTVVLFTPEGTSSTVKEVNSNNYTEEYNETDTPITYKYLSIYFNNGGVKALVYEDVSYEDFVIEGTTTTYDISKITELDNKYIYIVIASDDTSTEKEDCYEVVKELANTLNADTSIYGINEKILITATSNENDESSIKNLIVKYETEVGCEMTVAAYLSQIDVDEANSIEDYCFTEENVKDFENITNSEYLTLKENNINLDIKMSGVTRNFGGTCKDGDDLVNNFVRIILHQTLTNRLFDLLTQKIKLSTGISKIYTVIAQELERYKTCGYLTTDKFWKDKDYRVNVQGKVYTIVSKGDALINGYIIKVLPTLTSVNNATPNIYVVIADQYRIRTIKIEGKVI